MKTKKRRLTQHLCPKCGKHIDITIAPYQLERARKQCKICKCDEK